MRIIALASGRALPYGDETLRGKVSVALEVHLDHHHDDHLTEKARLAHCNEGLHCMCTRN